jgi:acid stress-induced BolA-like protein IbaG/YrbA
MIRKRDELCEKIEGILRKEFPNEIVDVTLSGIRDNIHVIVVSAKLDDLSEREKQEQLWSFLETGGLTEDELNRISLILPLSVAELRR